MPRERLPIGEHGAISLAKTGTQQWTARVAVRDEDGVRREVTARDTTKAGARVGIERKLKARSASAASGVNERMTVGELASFWLEHRGAHGRARGKGPLAPQTLASYADAIHNFVVPTLGDLRLSDLTIGRLDLVMAGIESGADGRRGRDGQPGRSTAQARTVLSQMFRLAVRHGAMPSNPMDLVEHTSRPTRGGRRVHHLTVEEVHLLRHCVRAETIRVPGRRMPNADLEDWVDFVLGTGCRDGEALAVRWLDLNLEGDLPTVHICGTIVEPRRGYVENVIRQGFTKTRTERTLILPTEVVNRLLQRRSRRPELERPADLVFATRTGSPTSPANIRARLRRAASLTPDLAGCSPHTLRRTVGTLIAHEVGLDAARDQLGHSDASVTFQDYVGQRLLAPDLRHVLDRFFG